MGIQGGSKTCLKFQTEAWKICARFLFLPQDSCDEWTRYFQLLCLTGARVLITLVYCEHKLWSFLQKAKASVSSWRCTHTNPTLARQDPSRDRQWGNEVHFCCVTAFVHPFGVPLGCGDSCVFWPDPSAAAFVILSVGYVLWTLKSCNSLKCEGFHLVVDKFHWTKYINLNFVVMNTKSLCWVGILDCISLE